MSKKYDVVTIGNALVDVLAHVDDAFLIHNNIIKGIMQLIDLARGRELYSLMNNASELCGGSAANTAAGLAMLGNKVAFIGKIKDDGIGKVFAHDIHSLGCHYSTQMLPHNSELETGRSMVLVTPDGERSMNTYLGAAEQLVPDDIDESLIKNTDWVFLEGYRFDGPDSQKAYREATRCCRSTGGKVAISLSDPFCVERHHHAFRELILTGIDLLLCNKAELLAMYKTESLSIALEHVGNDVPLAVCTMGEKGAIAIENTEMYTIDPVPTMIVDATGAGDQFAAGFLHGYIMGLNVVDASKLGCAMASRTIDQIGARPDCNEVQNLSLI